METQLPTRMPTGLTPEGKKAYRTILKILREQEMTYTGGCTPFYSPRQWAAREEQYGADSLLIVVYDGGDLAHVFNGDQASENGYCFHESLRKALEEAGFYVEECTNWYSAVYKLKR